MRKIAVRAATRFLERASSLGHCAKSSGQLVQVATAHARTRCLGIAGYLYNAGFVAG